MRAFDKETVADPISEARRYVDNAEKLLRENGKIDYETKSYNDRKYVRMAGNNLWNGILIALDAVFHVKAYTQPHPDIKEYKSAISIRDKKLLTYVNNSYDIIHVSMGYDGILNKASCDEGFRLANEIIERCNVMLKKSEGGKKGTAN